MNSDWWANLTAGVRDDVVKEGRYANYMDELSNRLSSVHLSDDRPGSNRRQSSDRPGSNRRPPALTIADRFQPIEGVLVISNDDMLTVPDHVHGPRVNASLVTLRPDQIVDVGRDGNCFFRCISLALFRTEEHHDRIRDFIADEMRDNAGNLANNSVLRVFGGDTLTEPLMQYYDYRARRFNTLADTVPENVWSERVRTIRVDGVYADTPELIAASRLIGVPIYVWRTSSTISEGFETWSAVYVTDCMRNEGGIYIVLLDESHFQHVYSVTRTTAQSKNARLAKMLQTMKDGRLARQM